jgi:hypothetical protein
MRDQIAMRVIDCLDDLPKEQSHVLLGKIVMLYILVEFSTLGHFHDDEDVVGGIEHLIQFDDIGMGNKLEYLDLAGDLHAGGYTLEIMFLFFIFNLFIIFTATGRPVNSCFAS